MKTIYPYLLQDKSSTNSRWSTVYGFGLASEMQKRANEYKGFWANRKVRVIHNPKYEGKVLEIPKKLKEGY